MKTIIEVEIENIEVDNGYYSFDYTITVDGKRKEKEIYSSDYDEGVWKEKAFKKTLEEGEAVRLALENFSQ
jgi:hypothetical protein